VEHEAELVAVVGKRGRHIKAENAKKHILGYTIGNDVTARDLQKSDNQWTRAKGFDSFCPFGPWIDTDFDPSDSVVTCRVNGQMRQMASTRDMVFNVATLVAFISSFMTLEPGDLIFTGTPSGVGELKDGDEVMVEIEGLGEIRNKVKAEGK
jgi:2-keto-4-pentenoate hydratase/2-oxohepta-3-ene-1,7-dioic acid hydratase in catechol pathway